MKPARARPGPKASWASKKRRRANFAPKTVDFFERPGNSCCQSSQVKAIRVVARFCICCFSLACAARIFFLFTA